ncbi:hypothetical protein ACB098_10G083000 [Castanea mollissima]
MEKRTKKLNKNYQLPHAAAIFERVRPTVRSSPEMGMNLMPLFPTLIQKRQFKKCSHISAFAGQSYKERNVRSIVLQTLTVRVKIDRPRVPADDESIGRHVLSDPHAFRERVPRDLELVGPIHRLGHRGRCRRARSRARR